ncbi:PepSY domain-containing protein [Roseomonas chloroacetimidivorans]|uniref:PepSY domain-containing protein n=1 Tax=Roseomonas chloroacetimidivorans TaxID=1766656 RepID=UPI003C770E57
MPQPAIRLPAWKSVWFQIHWFLGITAGLVLMVVGFTGGLLSFQDEIMRALNPGVLTVTPSAEAPLSPAELIRRIEAGTGARVNALTLAAEPDSSVRALLVSRDAAPQAAGGRPRGETRYADPYTGELLGAPVGTGFFRTTRELHRWLLAGAEGRIVVGVSTIALIILSLTGLYLRWPRRVAQWRSWFHLDFRLRGRSLFWRLHSVIGTWVLPLYLLASLTGLFWSFEWYRSALFAISGAPRPAQMGPPQGGARPGGEAAPRGEGASQTRGGARPAPLDLDRAWSTFVQTRPDWGTATLRIPGPGQPLRITYVDARPEHEDARNNIAVNAAGEVVEHRRYAELPLGQQLMGSMLALHSGRYFGTTVTVLMMLASLLMPLFGITGILLYIARRKERAAARKLARSIVPAEGGEALLIAYASQGGTAERLAWQSAEALRAAQPVRVAPLASLDAAGVRAARRALFVVSTFGEGEPPDQARRFAKQVMGNTAALDGLEYGLLSLGDRHYPHYCGFGRELDEWLRRQGATPLFDVVEADRTDEAALDAWRRGLEALGGKAGAALQGPAFTPWRLALRVLLNPGSPGGPVFHVELDPPGAVHWQAGDIAEVRPRHAAPTVRSWLADAGLERADSLPGLGGETLFETLAGSELPPPELVRSKGLDTVLRSLRPLPHRDYSIASIAADGRVHLLVRQVCTKEGVLGLGSGWLTAHAPEGGIIAMRIRSNTAFHPPSDDRPMILVGNGTGMAGLRAHLRHRAALGQGRNWLVFGERRRHSDFHYAPEIAVWQASGMLERLDLAFSRDQAERIYVQDRLREAADSLRDWVAGGAAIYVCGSQEGMAPGVEAVLTEVLGTTALEVLRAEGRYRRDVY